MPNQQKKERRNKGGAPLGNQNARKEEVTKRVRIRLYEPEQVLIKAIAKELKISQNEAHRQAIQRLAKSLGLSG